MDKIKENELYLPIKQFLESKGYSVKGEVKNCDIAAVKNQELIVVEMKTAFTKELIYQALNRQKIADSVYIAIPLPKKGYNDPHYDDMVYLCKRLEIGLIFIGFTTDGKAQLDVAIHPAPRTAIRRNKAKRLAVITEHENRTGSINTGGVSRRKIITVYKEHALKVAKTLADNGILRAEEIKKLCGVEKTSSILSKNFYGWYCKAEDHKNRKTTYMITKEGLLAIKEYDDLLQEGENFDGKDI